MEDLIEDVGFEFDSDLRNNDRKPILIKLDNEMIYLNWFDMEIIRRYY
jgi:hypothetical protein